jgi:dimethylhistidine N-methyltransferase
MTPARAAAGAVRSDPFARDVGAGLADAPRRIPPQWFYDELGSALFDAICRLPWYEVTRAELRLLRQHAGEIVAEVRPAFIAELGPGNGEKLAVLARRFSQIGRGVGLHLIDVSKAALDAASRTLAAIPGARVTTTTAAYAEGLADVARRRPPFGRALVAFLGSNLGNFDPDEADALLGGIRAALGAGDSLLLGLDLVKPQGRLELAYDDPLGVTAAFNRNLLARMNGELGANFDLQAFAHRATWNAAASRVEIHLVSLRRQTIDIPGAACRVTFEEGDTIWTESSYKYRPDDLARLGARAGFTLRRLWIDEPGLFALALFDVRADRLAGGI